MNPNQPGPGAISRSDAIDGVEVRDDAFDVVLADQAGVGDAVAARVHTVRDGCRIALPRAGTDRGRRGSSGQRPR